MEFRQIILRKNELLSKNSEIKWNLNEKKKFDALCKWVIPNFHVSKKEYKSDKFSIGGKNNDSTTSVLNFQLNLLINQTVGNLRLRISFDDNHNDKLYLYGWKAYIINKELRTRELKRCDNYSGNYLVELNFPIKNYILNNNSIILIFHIFGQLDNDDK